jgi:hypothetical protein
MFLSPLWKQKIIQSDTIGRILLISTLAFSLPAAASGHGKTSEDSNTELRLPESFGEVVYQEHGNRDRKIFIIAQSHRSAVSGEENEDCQKVQAEIYRIGEWLIANERVEALLPEGYFSNRMSGADPTPIPRTGKTTKPTRLDDAALAARLSNPTFLVNADRLLYTTYDLALRQIEDRQLYFSVVNQLRSVLSDSLQQKNDPTALSILTYRQKKRSAVILENIPQALTGGKSKGDTNIRRAMLTIGLSHVDTMIDFLKSGTAQILPPSGTEDILTGFCCDLSHLKERYAIAVIIPRTLADSGIMLRLSRLACTNAEGTDGNPAPPEPDK